MTQQSYTTPPGTDERRVDYPTYLTKEEVEAKKKKGLYFIDWNGYGFLTGPGCTMKFLNEIKARLNKRKGTFILITGPPGEGKTYFALRLAQIFDPMFDVLNQMCFSRIQILIILDDTVELERGQCMIADEAHISQGARSWGKAEQQDLMNLLATARSKGLLIIVVALHQKMLDVLLRKYMGAYQIGLEEPGIGTPYRLWMPRFENDVWKSKYDELRMSMPDAELCNFHDCLGCDYEDNCMTIRAVYERLKKEYLRGLSLSIKERIQAEMRSDAKPPRSKLMKYIYEERRDKIRYNNRGKIDFISIIDIIEEEGWSIGDSGAGGIAKSMYEIYPDLRPKEED